MKADIITIGDELLIGETVDTNGAWMAKAMDNSGVEIGRIITISDDADEITEVLGKSLERADLVLITGGLGPTHDDVTKKVLCNYFHDHLVLNEDVYEDVRVLLEKFERNVNELNRAQAMVPSNCEVIRNDKGTAPGMIFRDKGKIIVSMPGVPHEMKNMMHKAVIPLVKGLDITVVRIHKHIKTFGVAEADLSQQLNPLIENLDSNVKMAFLPTIGHVKIRISASDKSEELANASLLKLEKNVLNSIGPSFYGFDKDRLETVIGHQLIELGKSVSTAESCTGGRLAAKITEVAGSSAYFQGSVVAYSNEMKIDLLSVSQRDLNKFGAVSKEVVCQMASGIRKLLKTDYGLATSGIAGPDGGTEEKPVGTIWIAIADVNGERALKLQLGYNREYNISLTADHVLNLLRKELNFLLNKR